jgi:hypothetical protein
MRGENDYSILLFFSSHIRKQSLRISPRYNKCNIKPNLLSWRQKQTLVAFCGNALVMFVFAFGDTSEKPAAKKGFAIMAKPKIKAEFFAI